MARGAVLIRDKEGLDLMERRLLQEILLTGSWEQAAKNCGIDKRIVRRKLRENDAFREAYDELYNNDEVRTTERELNLIADDVTTLLEEVKNAEIHKNVPVTCPSCGHRFPWAVKIMDYASKIKVGEMLMKYRGYLKDQRSVKVEGNVQVEHVVWDMRDIMVMERLKMNLPMPEQAYLAYAEKAKRAGLEVAPMPQLASRNTVVEGEYSVATNDSDEQ